MKRVVVFAYVLMVLTSLISGCSTPKIEAEYVMPARNVANIHAVDVCAVKVGATLSGNMAGDQQLTAALLKHLFSMRLYKEGYYSVVDDIWGDVKGTGELQEILKAKDSGHGYASYSTAQGQEKVVVVIKADISVNSMPVTKEKEFTLRHVPYKSNSRKGNEAPSSSPDYEHVSEKIVKVQEEFFEVSVKGTLKVHFEGVKGAKPPELYVQTFKVDATSVSDSLEPSFLKSVAAAVEPAVDDLVADISPHRETQNLMANEDSDKGVYNLLIAKAFPEVVTRVDALRKARTANYADLENQGVAYEVLGELDGAINAYEEALKLNPETTASFNGVARVRHVLEGRKQVRASNAKKIASEFKSKGISTDR